jgi:hypothetical protein
MTFSAFLYSLPTAVTLVLLLFLHIVAAEICFAYGRRMPEKKTKVAIEVEMTADVIHTGMLTLLALLLAFTVSMSAYRFETRRQVVVDEANAIGTTYLRSAVVSKPCENKLRSMIRGYLDKRLLFYQAPFADPSLMVIERESKTVLRNIWDLAVACGTKEPNEAKALLLRATNTMIDIHETQLSSFENRIPRTLLILIGVASIFLMGFTGYLGGMHGQRPGLGAAMLSIFIVMTVAVIMDLDRPRQGLIRLDVTPLERLSEDLREK